LKRFFLGIDTSNYTTSIAVVSEGKVLKNIRKILNVEAGERGLRQSDAVFAHVKNIPELVKEIGEVCVTAVGCSATPRDVEGSYMPCFCVGKTVAASIAGVNGVPLYEFSHQRGHLSAALYSCGRMDLLNDDFLAFHVSGGTTELLHCRGGVITKIGGTLDISAGKLVDRVGVLLGLGFPCGAELEKLAEKVEKLPKVKISVSGTDCNLSGAENIAANMKNAGASAEDIAAYVISTVDAVITKMTENALVLYPGRPVLYAGGVMSNKIIRSHLENKFNGLFASPEYSCDNASGVALLTEAEWEKRNG